MNYSKQPIHWKAMQTVCCLLKLLTLCNWFWTLLPFYKQKRVDSKLSVKMNHLESVFRPMTTLNINICFGHKVVFLSLFQCKQLYQLISQATVSFYVLHLSFVIHAFKFRKLLYWWPAHVPRKWIAPRFGWSELFMLLFELRMAVFEISDQLN